MSAIGLSAFAVGIGLHIFLFRRGEWDLTTVGILGIATLLYVSTVISFVSLDRDRSNVLDAVQHANIIAISTVAGIFGSMVLYRGFFHRLCRFPGPFLARLSNFYVTSLTAKNMQLFLEVQKLHQQYGDIVRLGECNSRDST